MASGSGVLEVVSDAVIGGWFTRKGRVNLFANVRWNVIRQRRKSHCYVVKWSNTGVTPLKPTQIKHPKI